MNPKKSEGGHKKTGLLQQELPEDREKGRLFPPIMNAYTSHSLF